MHSKWNYKMATIKDIAYLHTADEFELLRFHRLRFRENDLSEKYFLNVTFEECDFSAERFREATFRNCRFVNCNWALAKFPESALFACDFTSCHLVGIDWTQFKWKRQLTRRKNRFDVSFTDCAMNYGVFVAMKMHRAVFRDCLLREALFTDADLEAADFSGCDLEGATFGGTDLTAANLSTARNYAINACANTLTHARFSFPEALALLYALDIDLEE